MDRSDHNPYATPRSIAELVAAPVPAHARATLREIITDAIRYWELRRLIYNAILAAIVIGYYFAALPSSRGELAFENIPFLFILTVLANACYCGAYVVDIIAQFSGFRVFWLRWRWLLLMLGIAYAAVITRSIASGFFFPSYDVKNAMNSTPNQAEPGAAGKPPGSLLSAMTLLNSNPRLAFHALRRPEAASA